MNEKELTHIDLFSGIGGFTLAGEWAGFRTIVFCEKEEFCQKVLQERFGAVTYTDNGGQPRNLRETISRRKNKTIPDPESSSRDSGGGGVFRPLLIPEIRDFDGREWRGATLLTGGFPCQPFSVAGQQRGKEDDRYLWDEMFRVIKEARPRWVFAENVPGIVKMALDTVLTDLESEGYSTGTFIVPACGVDAPHRRYRVWIIAHDGISQSVELSGSQQNRRDRIGNSNQDASHPTGGRQFQCLSEREKERNACEGDKRNLWQEDWHEVAAEFCRVDDGVPDRVHRLKALGNAIVPNVAYEIMKYIAWIERNKAS